MSTLKRALIAMATGVVLAGITATLLLSGYVPAAIWMEGPYFLLTMLLPGSVDRLPTMVIAVAAYYFAASLVVLKHRTRRVALLVVAIVLALNCLGLFAWRLQAARRTHAETEAARPAHAADEARSALDGARERSRPEPSAGARRASRPPALST